MKVAEEWQSQVEKRNGRTEEWPGSGLERLALCDVIIRASHFCVAQFN
jgi:hypothetical protein